MNDKDDKMDELRKAAKEAAAWYKENPPGRLRFTMLMMEDVDAHLGQLGSLWVGMSDDEDSDVATFMDKCEVRFVNTFGEHE